MPNCEPARTASRRTRRPVLTTLVAVGAALIAVLVYQSLAASSAPATSTVVTAPDAPTATSPRPPSRVPDDRQGAVGVADGVLPDGVTVFGDEYPAVAKLDPALLVAVRRAATDAARLGVTLHLDSGWRSPRYQEQLLRAAIAKYGSEREAARWVATPDTSAHVSGDAVDIGRSAATAWLARHGSRYGLCQIYRNEPWHYELRLAAIDRGCPPMYADPTHDPRMSPADGLGPRVRLHGVLHRAS